MYMYLFFLFQNCFGMKSYSLDLKQEIQIQLKSASVICEEHPDGRRETEMPSVRNDLWPKRGCRECLYPMVDPRVLSCGHSLCSRCLDHLAKSKENRENGYLCHKCHKRTRIPCDGAAAFRKDLHVQERVRKHQIWRAQYLQGQIPRVIQATHRQEDAADCWRIRRYWWDKQK
jgi:hypothetical protein